MNENDEQKHDDQFDPFLQSPLSFGEQSALENNIIGDEDEYNFVGMPGNLGFISTYTEANDSSLPIMTFDSSSSSADKIVGNSATDKLMFEFDPLLSPHSYANGIDAGPIESWKPSTNSNSLRSSTKLLVTKQQQQQQQQTRRVGILLIDHGSKRAASNEHIHSIARVYEDRLIHPTTTITTRKKSTIVRAAHMELAKPSILDSLRTLFTTEEVSIVICVPYFLSPGRHATEDVPSLIDDARRTLSEEGVLAFTNNGDNGEKSILVSDALGSQLESMIGAIDILVDQTLAQ